MAEYKSYINALKQCAKEHKNDNIPFANIRTTDLCNDTADLLERLESGITKAIEEIENEIKFWDCPVNYQEPLEVQRTKQAKANSYRHALEIIKSNIGE